MELTKPGLDILQPAWKDRAPASVDALFTCRDGGVSSGAYGNAEGIMGLNVAPHTANPRPMPPSPRSRASSARS